MVVMDTIPGSFHINTFLLSTGWYIVSLVGNNLGLHVTKPILFSTAYEGLQICILCCKLVSKSSCKLIAQHQHSENEHWPVFVSFCDLA